MTENFKIPVSKNDEKCGYFENRDSISLITTFEWFKQENEFIQNNEKLWFSLMLERGYRRSGQYLYINQCKNCSQCIPIRLEANKFVPSKSQRVVWRKNQDIAVKLIKDSSFFVNDEKAFMLREYDFYHNHSKPDYKKMTIEEAKTQLGYMTSGYSGIWNMEYYLNGKLIGVCILDYSEDQAGNINKLSSNYFYYDVSSEVLKRSIGVFSVLKEIELCNDLKIPFYYLGLYLQDCKKMNYKTNYKPYELYINEKWFDSPSDIQACINRELVFTLPYPGEYYNHPDICFITDDIQPQLLYSAYIQGIFPWFNEEDGDPVVWQCPEQRFVLNPEEIHVSKSLKKFLKKNPFSYTVDTCFEEVVEQCSLMKREGQDGTWIGEKIKKSYLSLHKAGIAHSIEVWNGEKLVGGFYGELIGSVFFGESMFTIEANSSKSAFVLFAKAFAKNGGKLIDCQAYTENMARYGASEIPRNEFIEKLKVLVYDMPQIKIESEWFN